MEKSRFSIAFLLWMVISSLNFDVLAQRSPNLSDQQMRNIINRIETRASRFRDSMNSALDNSNVQGTTREDNINFLVSDFQQQANMLRNRFDNRQLFAADIQSLLSRARRIDDYLSRYQLTTRAQDDWSLLRTDLGELAGAYNINPRWGQSNNRTRRNQNTWTNEESLTGTYRINTARSDNPQTVADRATRTVAVRSRQRIRNTLITRLDPPDMIALESRGQSVTIASTRAPQVTLDADGRIRSEQSPDGRTVNTRATMQGDSLTIAFQGDPSRDYTVTFDPVNNSSLRVTRTVRVPGLAQSVVLNSYYDKTSEVAQWNVLGSPQTSAGVASTTGTAASGEFVVPNGTRVVATLNNNLSTNASMEGDRFTMTVREPNEYRGATIEGHLSKVQRSGRITGRSEMTLNFDTIRLQNGRTYKFAGTIDNVSMPNGETVRVDREGEVQRDDSQTEKTVQRTAIGTALGAVIGAIAGGGKGAAIGAIVGAGAGAGSVYVQGREDLEMRSGSEVTINASAPIYASTPR
jgi:uncharacterized protein YcfJ